VNGIDNKEGFIFMETAQQKEQERINTYNAEYGAGSYEKVYNSAQSLISENNIFSEGKQQLVVKEFTDKRYNLLSNKSDKMLALAELINSHGVAKIMFEAASKANASELEREQFKQILKEERLYTISLISDSVNNEKSITTDILKEDLARVLSEMSNKAVSQNEIKDFLSLAYEKPICNIVKGLNLGKEQSFLDRLLH